MADLSRSGAQRDIAAWLREDNSISEVVRCVTEALRPARGILLVGGALRDRLLLAGARPKDVDFVVQGVSPEFLAERLPLAERNFYGGLRFEVAGHAVDLWPLGETFHIREFGLEATVEKFLAGAPFNMDKAAFDVTTGRLSEDGFLAGLRAREIAYVPLNPYLEHVQAARCVLLRRRTGFSLAESARSLMARASASMQRSDALVIEVHDFLRGAGIADPAARRAVIGEIASGAPSAPRASAAC